MDIYVQALLKRLMAEITCDSRTHEVIRSQAEELANFASDQVDRAHQLAVDLETQKDLRKKDAAFFEKREQELIEEIKRYGEALVEERQTIKKLKDDSAMWDEIKDLREKLCYEPGSDLTEALAQRREAIQELEEENRNLKRELRDAEDLLGAKVEGKTTELRKEILAAHKRIAALANQLKECWKCRERQGVYIDRLHNKHPNILLQSDFEKEQRLEILRGRLARIRDIAEGNGCE